MNGTAQTEPVARQAWWPWGFVRSNVDALKECRGLVFDHWPGWSTGEQILAALALDRADVLKRKGYTLAEAFDRAEVSAAVLLSIARELES